MFILLPRVLMLFLWSRIIWCCETFRKCGIAKNLHRNFICLMDLVCWKSKRRLESIMKLLKNALYSKNTFVSHKLQFCITKAEKAFRGVAEPQKKQSSYYVALATTFWNLGTLLRSLQNSVLVEPSLQLVHIFAYIPQVKAELPWI